VRNCGTCPAAAKRYPEATGNTCYGEVLFKYKSVKAKKLMLCDQIVECPYKDEREKSVYPESTAGDTKY